MQEVSSLQNVEAFYFLEIFDVLRGQVYVMNYDSIDKVCYQADWTCG